MKILLVIAMCIFCIAKGSAQTEKLYSVKMGEVPEKIIPREAVYLLPRFTQGTVFLKDGSSSTQRFNYNSLLDEMHFINVQGDTLAIAEPALINSVEIASIKFYYDSGYIQQIYTQENYKLAVKHIWRQIPGKKTGGYDIGSDAGSIETFSTFSNVNGPIGRLRVPKDVVYKNENFYYIGDKFNHFQKANKKNINAFFKNKNIAQYLEEHKVDFNKEEDMKALLKFCAE
jgi:hypothetical protein